jgi:hypothetical protein
MRPWRDGYGQDLALDGVMKDLAGEGLSVDDEWLAGLRVERTDGFSDDLILRTARRAFAPNVTVYGYEEERDPLGRPKVDLGAFQREAVGGEAWQTLMGRLTDKNYSAAYDPGNAAGHRARSYADGFNKFAGAGNDDPADGQAAVQQMLVNVVEAGRPHAEPPLSLPGFSALYNGQATNHGIWPAKSMPYVAEVATRVRSAFYLIPGIESNPPRWSEFIVNVNGTDTLTNVVNYRGSGHDSLWFLSHATVDLAFAFVNPNPFATNFFDGMLTVHYATPYTGGDATVTATDAPSGIYAPVSLPQSAQDAVTFMGHSGFRVTGKPAVFQNIGVVSGDELAGNPSWLKIEGWEIKDKQGQLFHVVPLPYVRGTVGSAARPWWMMAGMGMNVGLAQDPNSFQAYATNGPVAVGWLTPQTIQQALGTTDFSSSTNMVCSNPRMVNGQTDGAVLNQVSFLLNGVLNSCAVERVQCIDPTLGHRTGNPDLRDGIEGNVAGHFYGALGHPWRCYVPFKAVATRSVTVYEPQNAQDAAVSATVHAPDGIHEKTQNVNFSAVNYSSSTAWTYTDVMLPTGALPCLTQAFSVTSNTTNWSEDAMEGNYLNGIGLGADRERPGLNPVLITNGRLRYPNPLCSAPKGERFVALGELGFVHSGLMQRPIQLFSLPTDANADCVGDPLNGPPPSMLLDMLTPPEMRDSGTGRYLSDGELNWEIAVMSASNSPTNPRHGLWDVNCGIADDDYLALREGDGDAFPVTIGTAHDVSSSTVRVVWGPFGQMFQPITDGSGGEYSNAKFGARGLDPWLSPFPRLRRGWESWLSEIGGDFTQDGSAGEGAWGGLPNAVGYHALGWPMVTWSTGIAGGKSRISFDPNQSARAQLLTLGVDGRQFNGSGANSLMGLFSADQGLSAMTDANNPRSFYQATRFAITPLRQFVSEINEDTSGIQDSLDEMQTALNGTRNSYNANSVFSGIAGVNSAYGVFKNMPMALAVNAASTSANAFTCYIVAQKIDDTGARRRNADGTFAVNSGPGFIDFDDHVVSECWERVVLVKVPVFDDSGNIKTYPQTHGPMYQYQVKEREVLTP